MRYFKRRLKGFTLIELILSIVIIVMILSATAPMFQSLQNKNDLEVAVNETVQTMRRAQSLSRAVEGDSRWGVNIRTGYITLFRGNGFSSRDATYDEDYQIPTNITVGPLHEVVFEKVSGEAITPGNITLTSPPINEQRTISINVKGTLNY